MKFLTPREVELTDGTRIKSLTLVWTAGTSPHPLLNQLDLPKERNRLKTNALMEVEGCPGVWALGDCAMIPDGKGGYQPPTAQHALREGKVLAHNIVASVRGEALINALRIQNTRSVSVDRAADRCRANPRIQLLRIHRLVALAYDLSAKTATR